jgi:hypothetical protein
MMALFRHTPRCQLSYAVSDFVKWQKADLVASPGAAGCNDMTGSEDRKDVSIKREPSAGPPETPPKTSIIIVSDYTLEEKSPGIFR